MRPPGTYREYVRAASRYPGHPPIAYKPSDGRHCSPATRSDLFQYLVPESIAAGGTYLLGQLGSERHNSESAHNRMFLVANPHRFPAQHGLFAVGTAAQSPRRSGHSLYWHKYLIGKVLKTFKVRYVSGFGPGIGEQLAGYVADSGSFVQEMEQRNFFADTPQQIRSEGAFEHAVVQYKPHTSLFELPRHNTLNAHKEVMQPPRAGEARTIGHVGKRCALPELLPGVVECQELTKLFGADPGPLGEETLKMKLAEVGPVCKFGQRGGGWCWWVAVRCLIAPAIWRYVWD
jgi:hypothetical protein